MDLNGSIASPPKDKHALSPDTAPLTPVKSPPDESTSFPLAAQIPLPSFTLPSFPPTASRLRELTLTSDIPLPDYQNLVTTGAQYELPQLPPSITHLNLELFSLGFPGRNPHFLTNLAKALPNLKSITFFSCLLDGLTDDSRSDAEHFFDPSLTPQLREIHIIDSFVRPGFWTAANAKWSKRLEEVAEANVSDGIGIKIFEVSYTFRGHEDSDFLARLHGEELTQMIQPGMLGVGFGLVEVSAEEIPEASAPEANIEDAAGNKLIDSKKKEVAGGILPFASDSRATVALKKRFASLVPGSLLGIKVLNLSLWTLTVSDLEAIVSKITANSNSDSSAGELADLTVSLLLTEDWLSSLLALFKSPKGKALHSLAGLEIIGVPSKPIVEGEDWHSNVTTSLLGESQQATIGEFGNACPRLAKVEMSILKANKVGFVRWARENEGGRWTFTKT